nr:uncharacterized protein LOC115259438 [Aedes albopictus]
MSQVDEVLPGGIGGDNNSGDSGDVEQLALAAADSGCNLPVVSSSESSSAMEKITAAAGVTIVAAESDETGLDGTAEEATESVAVALARRAAHDGDGYEPCDPLIILNLFQSLSTTTNSLELQMKINLHLKKLTKSPYVFLVPILHSSEEGLIQVINDNVLDKEIRFSINSTHLKNTSQQNGYPFIIDDLNKDFSEVIEMVSFF